jgi:HNH endonuclease
MDEENIITCACGCGQSLSKHDKYGRPRTVILGHQIRKPGHRMKMVDSLPRGDIHYNWKGGKTVNSQGYVMVKAPWHPRAIAAERYRVREHILVMEQHLGRYLLPGEEVHHINENKQDNRIENLQLTKTGEHRRMHTKKRHATERVFGKKSEK